MQWCLIIVLICKSLMTFKFETGPDDGRLDEPCGVNLDIPPAPPPLPPRQVLPIPACPHHLPASPLSSPRLSPAPPVTARETPKPKPAWVMLSTAPVGPLFLSLQRPPTPTCLLLQLGGVGGQRLGSWGGAECEGLIWGCRTHQQGGAEGRQARMWGRQFPPWARRHPAIMESPHGASIFPVLSGDSFLALLHKD